MRPADLTPVARDVMKLPASAGLIFFSLVGAYVLAALPWQGQWMMPLAMLLTAQPWWGHLVEKALKVPAAGCVTAR